MAPRSIGARLAPGGPGIARGRDGYPPLQRHPNDVMPKLTVDNRNAPALPKRYAISRHIANGGMASLWAAEDCVLGRNVAIKVLARHLAGDPENARRFEREARAAARVSSHPNVVTIYDVGEAEGRAFIVMEYLSGGSVADAVRAAGERGVSRPEAVAWLRDAAAALDAAHGLGIVHRDIKPANLLLDDRRRALVADFGIARLATEGTMTTTGQLLGTAAYLSPEQALGEPATAASDIYSLAVVGYELLTGTRPFRAEHFAAQARQHVDAVAPPASERDGGLSRAVDPVLARGLAKDPDERWLSATAFVDALERAVGRPRPAAAVESPTEVTRPLLGAVGGVAAPRAATAAAAAAPRREVPPVERSGRGGRLALVALGVVALLVPLVVLLSSSGGEKKTSTPPRATAPASRRSAPASRRTPPGAPGSASASSTSPSTSSARSGASPGEAAALQLRGHDLLASDPKAALPILQQAKAATGQSTANCRQPSSQSCLTYAYALYDIGQALLISGNADQAVSVLQERSTIDNGLDIVLPELARARQAASSGAGGGAAPAAGGGGDQQGKGQAKGKKSGKG